jgi:hypothetical protein
MNMSAFQKLNADRIALENNRRVVLKRIQTELNRIRVEEKVYGKELLKQMIPVRVTLNPKLVETLKAMSPVQITVEGDETPKTKPVSAEIDFS